MLTTGKALATICWLAALIALLAAAVQAQTVMGIAGLVGAAAACAWGLVKWLAEPEQREPERSLVTTTLTHRPHHAVQTIKGGREAGHAFGTAFDNTADAMHYDVDDELPYRPPARAPYWPNEAGAPE